MAKNEKTKKAKNSNGFFARMVRYFKDTKAELKRVTWPTRSQTVNSTVVVIVTVLIVGACIWSLDFVFKFLIDLLLSL